MSAILNHEKRTSIGERFVGEISQCVKREDVCDKKGEDDGKSSVKRVRSKFVLSAIFKVSPTAILLESLTKN